MDTGDDLTVDKIIFYYYYLTYIIKTYLKNKIPSANYSYDEFITPSDRQKCQLRENTNVFSYFFVKSFIYLSLKEWLISCCDQGTARFIDTHDGQETLKQIIQSGYENIILMKIINTEILKNHTKTADKSLKMMVVL